MCNSFLTNNTIWLVLNFTKVADRQAGCSLCFSSTWDPAGRGMLFDPH